MKRYVWFNPKTGEFSDSWTEEEHDEYLMEEGLERMKGWKLIKYECENDKDFEFYNRMKIVTL